MRSATVRSMGLSRMTAMNEKEMSKARFSPVGDLRSLTDFPPPVRWEMMEPRDLARRLGKRDRLEHELRGFGRRHEIPRRLTARHRHRPARRDLALEQRDHAAVRAEHVTEPH